MKAGSASLDNSPLSFRPVVRGGVGLGVRRSPCLDREPLERPGST